MSKAKQPKQRVGVNVTLPADLHTRVRIRAVQEGATMEAIVVAALVLYVSTPHKAVAS